MSNCLPEIDGKGDMELRGKLRKISMVPELTPSAGWTEASKLVPSKRRRLLNLSQRIAHLSLRTLD